MFQSICRNFLFTLIPCSKILSIFEIGCRCCGRNIFFIFFMKRILPCMSIFKYMLFWTSSSLRFWIFCSPLQIWTWDWAVLSWIFTFLFVRTTGRTYWWNILSMFFENPFLSEWKRLWANKCDLKSLKVFENDFQNDGLFLPRMNKKI